MPSKLSTPAAELLWGGRFQGHTYNLDLGEYGSPTYALPAEVEAYQVAIHGP